MGDPVRRARLGAAARALVDANRGAKDKTLDVTRRSAAAAEPPRGRGPPLPRGPLSASQRGLRARRASAALAGTQQPSARAGASLDRPVISVGNLVGRRQRQDAGRRGARAAAARDAASGPRSSAADTRGAIARDGVRRRQRRRTRARAVERSGDEPQMLARALPGVPVLVCAGSLSGRPARRAAASAPRCMLLDDGFQHLQLGATSTCCWCRPAISTSGVLPAGRLREPLDAARAADALLVPATSDDGRRACAAALGVTTAFQRGIDVRSPAAAQRWRSAPDAGVARASWRWPASRGPSASFDALREHGWDVVARADVSRSSLVHARDRRRRSTTVAQERAPSDRRDDREGCGAAGRMRAWLGGRCRCTSPSSRPTIRAWLRRACADRGIGIGASHGCGAGERGEVPPRVGAGADRRGARARCCRCRLCARCGGALGRASCTVVDGSHRRIALDNLARAFPIALRRGAARDRARRCSRTSAACCSS